MDETERAKREQEPEAVAYVVGPRFDLDMHGSAFYLAAWQPNDPETLRDRLARVSRTAETIVGHLAAVGKPI